MSTEVVKMASAREYLGPVNSPLRFFQAEPKKGTPTRGDNIGNSNKMHFS